MTPRGAARQPPRARPCLAVALATTVVLTAVGPGCATRPPPVSKIIAGRVVVTRAIHPDAYEHVARAELFAHEERWEEAIGELERALNYDRDAPEIHARIAELELELGRDDRAAKAAAASLEIGETVDGLVALAHVRQRKRDLPGAVAALRRATDLASFGDAADVATMAYLELADAQLESLDIAGARQTLTELANEAPGSTVARIRLAGVAWALGTMNEAERRLLEAVRIEPNHIEALLTLAWLATAGGQLDEARARFEDALERAEGALDVAAAYARFLVLAGKPDEAAQLADDLGSKGDDDSLVERMELYRSAHQRERALEIARARRGRPEIAEELAVRIDLAMADLLAEKQPKEALPLLLRVPKGTPAHSAARLRAAELLRRGGQLGEARRLLRELEADPPSDGVRDEVVAALAALDEKDDPGGKAALARFAAALAQRPTSARLRLGRAALLERHGRVREALADAEAVLSADPGSAEALNFWGFLAADHGLELPRAEKRIQAALAFDPGSGAILDSLGWAYLKMGKLEPATLFLQQAGRLEPDDAEILGHLAALMEKKGDRRAAVAHLRKALGRSPDEPVRARLEAELRRLETSAPRDAARPPSDAARAANEKAAPAVEKARPPATAPPSGAQPPTREGAPR